MRPAIWPLLYATHAACFAGALLDDSYISFRYAYNLARGLGLVFNRGERVEGYTNFSWVCLSAAGLSLGLKPEWLMQALALIAGIVLTWWVTRKAAELCEYAGAPQSAETQPFVAPLLIATSSGLAFYAGSGLETVFFSLLFTAAAIACVERHAFAFALLTSLAFMTRPEAALIGLLGSALFAYEAHKTARWRALFVVLGTFALCLLPYLAFKQIYFGDLIPNTLRAKEPRPLSALHYVATGSLPIALLALIAGLSLWRDPKTRSRARIELLVFWGAYTLAMIAVGPDWMPAHRLLVHALPLFALVCDGPVHAFLRAGRGKRALALLALFAFVGAQAQRSISLFETSRSWVPRDELARALAHKLIARGVRRFATVNIGLLGYEAAELEVVDLAGLVDPVIGRLPGPHLEKRPSDAYLLERKPDVYILTSSQPIQGGPNGQASYVPDFTVEAHVFARPWFMQRYAYAGTLQFSESYYYHLFERRDLSSGSSDAHGLRAPPL